jgi:ankyrin repeat protein
VINHIVDAAVFIFDLVRWFCRWTALFAAVFRRNADMVKLLITHGANPDIPNRENQVAFDISLNEEIKDYLTLNESLVHYSKRGDLPRVTLLLTFPRLAINLDYRSFKGITALTAAASKGFVEIARKLLVAGASANASKSSELHESPLWLAAAAGNVELVSLLLEYGADANAPICSSSGGKEIVVSTPLLVACLGAHLEIVNLLINATRQADPLLCTSGQSSVLHEAALGGSAACVKFLLSLRRDKATGKLVGKIPTTTTDSDDDDAAAATAVPTENVVNGAANDNISFLAPLLDKSNVDGCTALYHAAAHGNVGVMRVLISAGADINKVDNEYWTPLCIAAYNGHLDAVRVLHNEGADGDIKTSNGKTAADLTKNAGIRDTLTCDASLLRSVASGDENACACLLQLRKINVNVLDGDGFSALLVAIRNGHTTIALNLQAAGADVNLVCTAVSSRYSNVHQIHLNHSTNGTSNMYLSVYTDVWMCIIHLQHRIRLPHCFKRLSWVWITWLVPCCLQKSCSLMLKM